MPTVGYLDTMSPDGFTKSQMDICVDATGAPVVNDNIIKGQFVDPTTASKNFTISGYSVCTVDSQYTMSQASVPLPGQKTATTMGYGKKVDGESHIFVGGVGISNHNDKANHNGPNGMLPNSISNGGSKESQTLVSTLSSSS